MYKTVLVTGSAGFIGFHLSKKLLESGKTVIGVDNLNDYYDVSLKNARNKILKEFANFIHYPVDIRNSNAIKEVFVNKKIDKICHLAAQAGVRYSLENPVLYEETNIKGFLNILELAREYGIQDIVYASSSSVYGSNKMPKKGFIENDLVNKPISVYGATKLADELLGYTYHHLYKMHMTGLRFFTVYGPWGRPDMAYFKFVNAIIKNETIDIYNNGNMLRDFTYIDDIVIGIINAIEKSYPYEIFNLGNSHPVNLHHFIEILEKELGMKATKKYKSMQSGDLVETFANIDKAKAMLAFYPKTSLEEGLYHFVSWYKKYYL